MVALQVRGVSEAVRSALASEAERRGESLQVFLLDVLEREAGNARNRDFVRRYRGPFSDGRDTTVDVVEVIHRDRRRDGSARDGDGRNDR